MNKISLLNSLRSSFNKSFNEKYQNFLLDQAKYHSQYFEKWPISWKIINEILSYMIRESKNPVCSIGFSVIEIYINDLLGIINSKTPYILESFLNNEQDIFTNFITFLKNVKNNGKVIKNKGNLFLIFQGFFLKNDFTAEILLKIIKIFKTITAMNNISELFIQKVLFFKKIISILF